MKFTAAILSITLTAPLVQADFFRNDFLPIGHVRTDPIINQDCLSDHVHSFYGPPLLYPKVTFDDLRESNPELSSGNIMENQSLYWHPTVYTVAADGTKTLQESEMTTVYYVWIPGQTVAFPPGFRMITPGEEVFEEGERAGASEMEISISFQSCWDGTNLDSADHKSHVAFPDGEGENAPCPASHPVRIPRLDFFIRWFNTPRAKWEFSDQNDPLRFHADYISGWDQEFLQQLLDGGDGQVDSQVTFRAGILHQGDDQELIQQMNANAANQADTSCITTEVIDNIVDLPVGNCTGTLISPYGVCDGTTSTSSSTTQPPPTTTTTSSSSTFTTSTTSTTEATTKATTTTTQPPPTTTTTISTTSTSTSTTTSTATTPNPSKSPTNAPVTPSPTTARPSPDDGSTDLRYVVCGRGVGPGLASCAESDTKKVHKDELHEVRCCKEQEDDGQGWRSKCDEYDTWIKGRSKIGGECHVATFRDAFLICNEADGRLCMKEEMENSCTKGADYFDRELVWTCSEEGWECTYSVECCSGQCLEDGTCGPHDVFF